MDEALLTRRAPWTSPRVNGSVPGGASSSSRVPTQLIAATALAFFAMVAMAAIEVEGALAFRTSWWTYRSGGR